MTTRVIGTGSYVPENIVTNDDLAEIVDTNDEWICSRTGICQRRISADMGTSDMAALAAVRALEDAGVEPSQVDIIVLATSSADYSFPSGACEVQGKIGAVNAVAFDLSAACTGFIFALNTVHSFIRSGIYKTGLVIGAESFSKMTDWSDRNTCVLFGDGAGAAVVKADLAGIIHMEMKSDGTKSDVLKCTSRTMGNFLNHTVPELGFTTMDGQEVFKFAVKKVPESIKDLLDQSGVAIEEIDYFVLHQANCRIVESIAKRLKLPLEKFPMNMDRYGNTSAASIPLMLDEMKKDGRLKIGNKLVLAGFGAGLTWGTTLLEW